MSRPSPVWRGPAASLPEALEELAREEELLLETIDAIDEPDEGRVRLVYVFHGLREGREIVVEAYVPRRDPHAPSIVKLVPAALCYEKEIYDLMGVVFEGNPGLREGFFKPEDMAGVYPLRKPGGS